MHQGEATPELGEKYAMEVKKIIDQAHNNGKKVNLYTMYLTSINGHYHHHWSHFLSYTVAPKAAYQFLFSLQACALHFVYFFIHSYYYQGQ